MKLQYRKNPKNGDKLSILGFGCMRLPVKNDGSIDELRASPQIRYAIDNGINYIDTAWPYHAEQSEPFIGRVLSDGYREKVKLATKLPTWMIKKREDMDFFLNSQLKKLKTTHIDYYLIHGLVGDSWDKVEKLDVADFLDKAKADGRIVNAGFSFHGTLNDFKNILNAYDWDFCQIQYNFLDEKNQAGTEGLNYAASKGLAVIIMEPLKGGMLTKSIPPAVKAVWDEALIKRTPAEWALRWVWNHPEVTVVLSGMNEEGQIEENLKTANEAYPNSLTYAELKLIQRVEREYRNFMKVGCTGCRYCMPCPSGVNIPSCFEIYNNLHISGKIDDAKFAYAAQLGGVIFGGKPGFASQCIKCGKCVEKCPQHLEIPRFLESVAEELEGPDLEKRITIAKKAFKQV